ncbi:hypothetical protein IE81DRAFT_323905 [Ceraceosorus guamensis]|uniref:Zinc finger CHCC-type domain-containing protein n=1 Tax=Ceraceosorus guamensis TaxID=1522189 RepID=A0A316VXA3_9BASI|nr:hypothetical protein IE81DRAFT_323905 [Ceraceosorus guamensis]PWN42079.1 hypothetical protein IE81DRAFT_323905 [Ceraceosorus guamensis]
MSSSRIFARSLSSSAKARAPPSGFFARPTGEAQTPARRRENRANVVAAPHTPPHIPSEQSPNYPATWSKSQNPRPKAMQGPRFEQIDFNLQPLPLSAMEMIHREPIRLTKKRVVACDGGDGPLGHPQVFINLDKPGPKACPYCGIRFEHDHAHH